jgi:hypothetical protein
MTHHQTTEAAQQFRRQYRQNINKSYSGSIHVSLVFGIGLIALMICLWQIEHWSAATWLIIALSLVFGNFGEYAIHRWLGHKKQPWASLFYARHTGDHHHFFVSDLMTCESKKDWRVLFFPAWLIVAVILLVALPLGSMLQFALGANAGWAWASGVIFTYLYYEISHYSYHLPAEHWLSRLPGLRVLRQRHLDHHDPRLMHHACFNITLPLFDYLLKTNK